MVTIKALCLAGVACLGATVGAHAADLGLPPPPPVYMPPPVQVGGGWYLRGDAGAGALQLRDENSSFNPDYAYGTSDGAPPGFANQGRTVSEQAIVDLGVGYQVNSYFRADVTGEYRFASKYHATETYATGYGGTGADAYAGNISSGVFLVNGYVDLGTWCGVTPYLGAGVGVALNTFSGLTDYNLSYFNTASGSSASNTHTSVAYALMAGVSYNLTQNLKLDIGYRYLDMGRAVSGEINCYGGSSACGDNSRERQSAHLSSHDIRVGLRYQFADLPYAPRIPVIARY